MVVDLRDAFKQRFAEARGDSKGLPGGLAFSIGYLPRGSLPFMTTPGQFLGRILEGNKEILVGLSFAPVSCTSFFASRGLRRRSFTSAPITTTSHCWAPRRPGLRVLTQIELIASGVGLIVESTQCRLHTLNQVCIASFPPCLRLNREREGLEHHGVGLGSANFVRTFCDRVLIRQKRLTVAIQLLLNQGR